MFQQIEGGVTAAKGFSAASTAAGIKYKDRQDMAMVFSKVPCTVAGTFTTNVVKAAPVLWDKMIAEEKQTAQVVVINAGIANACTGEIGYQYCEETAKAAEEALKIPYESVFVASTGVIGKQLPIDKIKAGTKALAEKLSDTIEAGTDAAKAIMTTDTKKKEIAVSMTLGGKEVILGGMCKGSGMIHPNMCTMLGFITTDANISKELLDKALKEDVQDTYNMVSVDGDTSTNDTVLLMANGLAENEKVVSADSDDYKTFAAALHFVNEYLAKRIAEDGEGATKLFTAKVVNAKSKTAAKCLAKSVITSSLTKAAVYGNDANWGRILCALGYSGESFDPYKVDITITDGTDTLKLVENGMATDYSEEFATKILGGKEVTAVADMKDGEAEATAWGCDLTYDYVKINADYRS
ncbi:MAG: bifunctional glutamate N-acetyltransferase/amino-acid acetyltransferase ArgJ [Lachnospiraceae bacterium]|nr:bifunctional glutamate N-acetyltransferase/amino-acid acetyltransferase ArgJ [Lachnospiraceae bacterium]